LSQEIRLSERELLQQPFSGYEDQDENRHENEKEEESKAITFGSKTR